MNFKNLKNFKNFVQIFYKNIFYMHIIDIRDDSIDISIILRINLYIYYFRYFL